MARLNVPVCREQIRPGCGSKNLQVPSTQMQCLTASAASAAYDSRSKMVLLDVLCGIHGR